MVALVTHYRPALVQDTSCKDNRISTYLESMHSNEFAVLCSAHSIVLSYNM